MSKDKRLTVRQATKEVQSAYDQMENVVKQVLKEEFGFGLVRMERFMQKFGEYAAKECERIESEMRKKLR